MGFENENSYSVIPKSLNFHGDFPRRESFIPRLGMICSQGGNKYFPVREHLAQNKARFSVNKAALLKNKLALLTDNDGVLTKSGPSLPSDGVEPFK